MSEKVIKSNTKKCTEPKDLNKEENSIQFLETTRKLREAQRVHLLNKIKVNTNSD